MTTPEISDEELFKLCNQMLFDFAQKQVDAGNGKMSFNMPKFFAMLFEIIGRFISDAEPDREARILLADMMLGVFVHAANVCDECNDPKRITH